MKPWDKSDISPLPLQIEHDVEADQPSELASDLDAMLPVQEMTDLGRRYAAQVCFLNRDSRNSYCCRCCWV